MQEPWLHTGFLDHAVAFSYKRVNPLPVSQACLFVALMIWSLRTPRVHMSGDPFTQPDIRKVVNFTLPKQTGRGVGIGPSRLRPTWEEADGVIPAERVTPKVLPKLKALKTKNPNRAASVCPQGVSLIKNSSLSVWYARGRGRGRSQPCGNYASPWRTAQKKSLPYGKVRSWSWSSSSVVRPTTYFSGFPSHKGLFFCKAHERADGSLTRGVCGGLAGWYLV